MAIARQLPDADSDASRPSTRTLELSVVRAEAARDREQDREAQLVAQAYRSRLLADIARGCAGTLDQDRLTSMAVEGALAYAGADQVTLWLRDCAEDARLRPVAAARPGVVPFLPAETSADDAVARAASTGSTVAGSHTERQLVELSRSPQRLSVPLPAAAGQREPMGVLDVARADSEGLTADLRDGLGVLAATVASALEITRLHQQVTELSERDALTSLFNRRRLDEDLVLEVLLARRHDRPVGFVMVDVDHFKSFNDRHGHQAGDVVLRRLGEVLRAVLRGTDSAYRYGGEEFALLLRSTGSDAATHVAERLRRAVEEELAPWGVTASLGAASLPASGLDVDSLVAAADAALYAAKAAGRNTVRSAPGTAMPGSTAR